MVFKFFQNQERLIAWAFYGLLVFVAAFLLAPSRDGLQIIYLFAFFIPILAVLVIRRPAFNEYGGWFTVSALLYAGFSVFSSLWKEPEEVGFFLLQWLVLATWLCGACFVTNHRHLDIYRCLHWFISIGAMVVVVSIIYYYWFVYGVSSDEFRLWGWNIFRNPNEIGAMCGIIALLSFTLYLQSPTVNFFYLSLALVAAVGLVLSFSRSALLSFVITSVMAIVVIRPKFVIWSLPVFLSLAALTILLLKIDLEKFYIVGRGDLSGGRLAIWSLIFDQIKANPLFGTGMSKATEVIVPDVYVYNHAHNAWLDTFYRTGLVGFSLLLLHTIIVLRKFSSDYRLLPLFLWFAYGCICSLLDGRCFFWEIGAKWFLYWIPAGLIAVAYTQVKLKSS